MPTPPHSKKSRKGVLLDLRLDSLYNVTGVLKCGYHHAGDAYQQGGHTHSGFELIYVESGEATWELMDRRETCLPGGWAWLLPPGLWHAAKNNRLTPARMFWLIFEPTGFHAPGSRFTALTPETTEWLTTVLQQAGTPCWHASTMLQRSMAGCMAAILPLEGSAAPSPRALDRVKLAISGLLLQLADELLARQTNEQTGDTTESLVAATIRHIRKHLAEPLDVATLARQAGSSTASLTRSFRQETGQNPGDYIRRARCERAATLLADHHLSISDIALRCGFATSQYFATVFKRYTGVPPGQFRKTK